ncbi:MAG: dienelactone hydrolase family protein [Calditrichota bacterium]
MPIRFALLLALGFVTLIAAAQPVERSVSFPASPFQTYNALTVEWQIRQWAAATGVTSDARPEGVWRFTYPDDLFEEGIYQTTNRGELLVFTFLQGGLTTIATLEFKPEGNGTLLTITHEIPGSGKVAQRLRNTLGAWWDQRLDKLKGYLDPIPGGYLVAPRGAGPFPAILVLHDRFGLDRTVRGYCDSLAARGYVALAVDMFRGEATSDLLQANRFVELVSPEDAEAAAKKGMTYLRKRENVDRKRTGTWGLGYGGGMALQMATTDARQKACAVWHPLNQPADTLLSRIAAPVLLVFADMDVSNPHPGISSFVQSLVQAGVRVENRVLSGSRDFSDPSYGESYNSSATADAWRSTLIFFDKQLRL